MHRNSSVFLYAVPKSKCAVSAKSDKYLATWATWREPKAQQLSSIRSNPLFTIRWTCLSLVAIRQMVMDGTDAIARFAVSGIAQFQLDYGTPDATAFNGAQRIGEYLKTEWAHFEDLHREFEPGDLNRTGEEIEEILRDHELPVSELGRIEIEAEWHGGCRLADLHSSVCDG
jgi:hypothetical protein